MAELFKEDDGEDASKEPVLQLRLGEAFDEGRLPLVDLLDLSKGGFVVRSAPLGGVLDLVFEIVIREEVSIVEGSQCYLHRDRTLVSLPRR